MGLFDRFRRHSGVDASPSSSNNIPERRPELRGAWRALETNQLDHAAVLAKDYLHSSIPELARESRKLLGLVQFRKMDYAAAACTFHEHASQSSEANDWFNLCTSATLAGEIALGEHALENAIRCQRAADYTQQPSVPFMRYYFACALRDRREFKKAMEQIDELRGLYEQLGITDTTFVYIRGVPFLSHTMNVAFDVFKGLGNSFDASTWIDQFASKLDEEGRNYLQEFKQRLRDCPISHR